MSIRAKLVAVASLLVALIAFPSASPAADGAFVRINQLGYLTGSPARAYLMSKNAETGATFQVLNARASRSLSLRSAPASAPGATSPSIPSISRRPRPAHSRSK